MGSNRQELQSEEQATGQWASSDLNCSVAPPGHVPSLGLVVSNWDSKVRLEGLWGLFQFLLSFTPSLLLTRFLSLSLSLILFCSLPLTLLLILSFALSAKHPRAYYKHVTGLLINIPHSIQPEVCSCFRGLPWGGTGLFQKAESWPVPGFLCTHGLEPVDRRKLISYPTRMRLWTRGSVLAGWWTWISTCLGLVSKSRAPNSAALNSQKHLWRERIELSSELAIKSQSPLARTHYQ